MRWLLTTLLVLQCATCGQKGPLTLPDSRTALPRDGAAFAPGGAVSARDGVVLSGMHGDARPARPPA